MILEKSGDNLIINFTHGVLTLYLEACQNKEQFISLWIQHNEIYIIDGKLNYHWHSFVIIHSTGNHQILKVMIKKGEKINQQFR